MQRVAVVIPVLNEVESLSVLLPELTDVLASAPFESEVFVVDDGSSDHSAAVASEAGATVLRSGRNLGKAAALQAGFDATVDFDVIVTLDGDLQDDPAEIPRLVRALDRWDMVSGWKAERQDPLAKRTQSRLFTGLVRGMTGIDLHDFNCGLKAYRRPVLDAIRIYGDHHRLIPVLAARAGFEVGELKVNHRPRLHGESKYGWSRAFRGPFDLMTILFLDRFGHRPLHVFGLSGAFMAGLGFAIGVYLSWLRIVQNEAIGNRPLLLLAVLLLLGGIQVFATGLLGELILAGRFATRANTYTLRTVRGSSGRDRQSRGSE